MIETVRSGPLTIEYDMSGGAFSLKDTETGREVFESAHAEARLNREGRTLNTREAASRLQSTVAGALVVLHNFRGLAVALELTIEPLEDTHGFALSLSIENSGGTDLRDVDFYPLALERARGAALFGHGGGHDFRFLRSGFLTWSGAGVYEWNETLGRPIHKLIHDGCSNPEVNVPRGRGQFIGEWFGAVRDNNSGGTLVAGFISTADQLSQIDFKSRDGHFYHLKAVSRGGNRQVAEGGSLESEKLAIIPARAADFADTGLKTPDFDAPLKDYARLAALPAPPPTSNIYTSPPVGWCSWYYYYHRMSERVILENLEAAESLRDRLPIDIFQIDDGYEPAPGDWLETNGKFPNGLSWLAGKIRDAGLRPGLWLAPFFATNRSRLFRRHTDWFVRREDRRPRRVSIWPNPDTLGFMHALDTTHPEALRWLHKLFSKIVDDWGYDYLKLDFMYNGAIDGLRHDPKATRAQAFRCGLETIRDAAGKDSFILGCGIPLALGLGLVNASRVSGDTAPYWHSRLQTSVLGHPGAPGVFNSAFSNFARYFLNGPWGWSDPDCLMCRFDDTRLNGSEVLTHAAIVALSGGPLFISDNLTELRGASIRLAQQLIPPLPDAAVPVDLFDNSPPATLVKHFSRRFDPVTIVGRFNWANHTADLALDFSAVGLRPDADYHVYDLWEDRYHGVCRGSVTLPRVPAHGSRILSIRPAAATPQLVASTFHFTQGGVDLTARNFDPREKLLALRFSVPGERDGRIYFHCPPPFRPESCVIDGSHQTAVQHDSGALFHADLAACDDTTVDIRFR